LLTYSLGTERVNNNLYFRVYGNTWQMPSAKYIDGEPSYHQGPHELWNIAVGPQQLITFILTF